MEQIDLAFKKFEILQEEIKGYDHSIFTEQDSRIKILDRVLIEVLKVKLEDIRTEERTGVGYLDYKVIVNGVPRLIVEAKRDGLDFDIGQEYSGRAFNLNGPVFKDKAVQDGIEQAIYYSAHKSVELCCLTNGRTWIIFRGNRIGDGKDVLEGKGIVFSTLDCVKKNFKLFYELLSPEAIFDLRYRAIFQEEEGVEIRSKNFYKALKTENHLKAINRSAHAHDFDKVMTEFFSKLSGDSDPELLTSCFVETKESQIADKQLARISEDLATKIRSLETEEASALRTLIERVKETNRHEFVVLIGSKGAGKSTFVERFFGSVLVENIRAQCIVIRINLAESDGNENTIIDWLNQTLLDECEKVLYEGQPTYEQIQGLHWHEYERLSKGPWRELYETNKSQFKIDFGKHIEERRENRPNEYIKRLIGDITRSRFKVPCIIFDNTDHFSIDFQEKVFQYARAIYEKEICLVIVPITDKTSWQLSKQGAIQSFENEVLYLPVPSPKKIIEKRIQYLDSRLKTEDSGKGQYFLQRGIKLEIKNISKFVKYLQNIFLSDNYVAKWIGEFANYDIRRCLDLTRDLISSPYLSLEELLTMYAVKANNEELDNYQVKREKIKTALIKRHFNCYPINRHTYIQNLFYFTGNLLESPLLSLRILQLFVDKRNDQGKQDNYVTVDQILDYFNGMSIDRTLTSRHLDLMLKKGLIYSYDPTVLDIASSKRVEISPAGLVHHHWCLNDNDYLFHMAEVTPIADNVIYNELDKIYYTKYRNQARVEFLNYVETEDKLFLNVPDHIAYLGQQRILTRIQERRSQINDWIASHKY